MRTGTQFLASLAPLDWGSSSCKEDDRREGVIVMAEGGHDGPVVDGVPVPEVVFVFM